jgi:AcrR family transcriptional regulator
VVHGYRVTVSQRPAGAGAVSRRRGDRQRRAIVTAVREMLEEGAFADLSVSAISDRAGVARSGFYFYFDSKYAVLAQLLAEATQELEELTQHFAPRSSDESPEAFAKRMVGSAAVTFAHNDPLMSACAAARASDDEIRRIQDEQINAVIDKIVKIVSDEAAAGTARPVSDDIPMLIRTLGAASVMALSGESVFVGPAGDLERVVAVLEQLWLTSLWGGAAR